MTDLRGLPGARAIGMVSATAVVLLELAYAATLTIGLLSLRSPDEPISDPWFSTLEILILLMMPAIVALVAAVHAWAPPGKKVFSAIALVFASLLAGLTSSIHFVILTLPHAGKLVAFRPEP